MPRLTITVDIDPGDCPEVRARILPRPHSVGRHIPEALREAIGEALYVVWPTERYGGNADTYQEPTIGRIRVSYDGPRDTYKGR